MTQKRKINFDTSKPDGILRKFMGITHQIKLGLNAIVDLEYVKTNYECFLESPNSFQAL